MGFFVVNKITWLIQQTCDRASTNIRELVEMVNVGKAEVLAVQCLLLTPMGKVHLGFVCHVSWRH